MRRSPSHAWLAGDRYSIADAAFTPYVVRLEHLDVLGLLDSTPRVADWYRRIKARPSFAGRHRALGERRLPRN